MRREVVLSPLDERSLCALEAWFQDGEVRKRLGGMLPLCRWFDYARTEPGRFTWMAYEESTPVGLLDLETSGGHTAWATVLVNPELRGRGYGTRILQAMFACPEARCRKQIKAIVERENIPSLRILCSLGFAIEWAEPDEEGFAILAYSLAERQAA